MKAPQWYLSEKIMEKIIPDIIIPVDGCDTYYNCMVIRNKPDKPKTRYILLRVIHSKKNNH